MIAEKRIRELVLQVWGEQACRNPAHWPATLARLYEKSEKRGSYRPHVDHAVTLLTLAVNTSTPLDGEACWRAFARFDKPHAQQLADLLERERSQCRTGAT